MFEELEETIEQIYNRADRSDKRIDVLVEGENQFEQDEMRKEYGRIFEDEEKHNFERDISSARTILKIFPVRQDG